MQECKKMIIFAGMKKVLVVILLAMVLVAGVTGCGGARYDGRLVAADSMMQADPDSALALVSAVSPDSLATEGDRAYRDLLLSQARYKAYQEILASDDSAITRAMAWYRAHSGEREKLTRAYLYKGAVMQELGHVDSAMYYYKTAEITADEKDCINLAQINNRIADLYRICNGNDQTCYEKYQKTYEYYCLTGNKTLQYYSLYCMYMMAGITHQGQREELFRKAMNLANEFKDNEKVFEIYEIKCRQLSRVDSTRDEAKRIALLCLSNYAKYINNDLMLDLGYIYTTENKIDSANYFLELVNEALSPGNEQRIALRKYEILSMIANLQGNTNDKNSFVAAESCISDSIINRTEKYSIEKIENEFNNNQYKSSLSRISNLYWIIISLSIIALLVIALIAAYLRRLNRTKAIMKELENFQLDSHENLIRKLDDKSDYIERLLSNLVTLLKSCANNEMNNSTSKMSQKIKENIAEVANDSFWKELWLYLDKRYNGIISKLANHPNITVKDLKFIELICCGFNNVEIAIILGYAPKYVSNKRKILAEKLGIDLPLQDHLNRLMGNTFQSDHQKQ